MASGPGGHPFILGTAEDLGAAGLPASYGQACKNCSRAKYRCIYRTDGSSCERCYRLKKECIPSQPARRLTSRRAIGLRTAHVQHLEERIEELVTLLRNQRSETLNSAPNTGGTNVPTPALSIPSLSSVGATQVAFADVHNTSPGPSSTNTTIESSKKFLDSHFDQPCLIRSSFEPNASQAEEYLSVFRTNMLSFFPFVYLPPAMTAKQIRRSTPFLWFNIMAIVSRNSRQQRNMSDQIKCFLAQKLVVDNEKNLDLLLGLLAFICWFHFHRKDRSSVSVMASLATALLFDMGLNKAIVVPTTISCRKGSPPPFHTVRTMVERRVVLSLFLITSQAAYAQEKIDALEWSPHMDECLQILSQCPEWPGDEQLATQVKIQLIIEQMRRGYTRSQEYLSLPSFSRALRAQLEKLKTQLSATSSQNSTAAHELLYAELVVQDEAILKAPNSAFNPDPQRHQLLENHLETIICWFDLFFAIPLDLYPRAPFSFWCHMAHTLMLLYRLYVLDDPAWDRAGVRARLDLFALCDRLAAILDDTATHVIGGERATEDLFIRLARIVRSRRNGWLLEIQAQAGDWMDAPIHQRQEQSQDQWPGQGQSAAAEAGGFLPATSMISDDAWLQDIFNVSLLQ